MSIKKVILILNILDFKHLPTSIDILDVTLSIKNNKIMIPIIAVVSIQNLFPLNKTDF